MPKERPKVKSENDKENQNEEDVPIQRPISARERPFEAYVAAKEAREHRYHESEVVPYIAIMNVLGKLNKENEIRIYHTPNFLHQTPTDNPVVNL